MAKNKKDNRSQDKHEAHEAPTPWHDTTDDAPTLPALSLQEVPQEEPRESATLGSAEPIARAMGERFCTQMGRAVTFAEHQRFGRCTLCNVSWAQHPALPR